MHRYFRVLLLLISPLLFGCSTTTKQTIATIGKVAFGNDDVVLGKDKINSIPYASAYIKVGDNPQAFVVLAYADKQGNLSWMSADHRMFVTRAGRLIKTIGLDNDLVSLSSLADEPLTKLTSKDSLTWQFQAEWEKDYVSGYFINSHILKKAKATIDILDEPHQTELFEELISIQHNGYSWENYYWVDQKTGQIVKSKQQLGPDLPVIEITILKPYAP